MILQVTLTSHGMSIFLWRGKYLCKFARAHAAKLGGDAIDAGKQSARRDHVQLSRRPRARRSSLSHPRFAILAICFAEGVDARFGCNPKPKSTVCQRDFLASKLFFDNHLSITVEPKKFSKTVTNKHDKSK